MQTALRTGRFGDSGGRGGAFLSVRPQGNAPGVGHSMSLAFGEPGKPNCRVVVSDCPPPLCCRFSCCMFVLIQAEAVSRGNDMLQVAVLMAWMKDPNKATLHVSALFPVCIAPITPRGYRALILCG
jgi:hypothetical protein